MHSNFVCLSRGDTERRLVVTRSSSRAARLLRAARRPRSRALCRRAEAHSSWSPPRAPPPTPPPAVTHRRTVLAALANLARALRRLGLRRRAARCTRRGRGGRLLMTRLPRPRRRSSRRRRLQRGSKRAHAAARPVPGSCTQTWQPRPPRERRPMAEGGGCRL